MSVIANLKVTPHEYHRLGELGFFNGRRVQLIRGEVVEMSPMNRPHGIGIINSDACIRATFGPGSTIQVQLPLRIGTSEPEPDIAVVAGSPRDYADHPTTALLVVEVSDTTLHFDLTVKAELYAQAGIVDYWVLDIVTRTLHVLRDPRPIAAGGHRYFVTRTLTESDAISPLAAPQSRIRIADLLP